MRGKMDKKSTEATSWRRRDHRRLSAGFLIVLAGLCFLGFLETRAALVAALLVIALAIAIGKRRNDEDQAPNTRNTVNEAEPMRRSRRAVISALAQPALLVRGQQIEAFNKSAAALFSLTAGASPPVAGLRNPDLLTAIATVQQGTEAPDCEIAPARFPEQFWLAQVTALDVGGPGADILIVLTDQAPVRKAERARADFLANASHELRTPLTSISGFIETMQGAAKDDQDAWPRFIDIIAEQASHMRGLITDLLSLSRIELGEHEEPDMLIDLGQTLSESVEAMSHVASARGLKIELNIDVAAVGGDGELSIVASENEVKQVVQNLVGNAMKYSPDSGTITVRAGRVGSEDVSDIARSWRGANRAKLLSSILGPGRVGAVWFSVCDQGEGIEPQFLPRLGERFFRVDASRGGPVEGTGLGLAIVKHIMAHHRGGFAVESVVGEGAQFTVWFKAA